MAKVFVDNSILFYYKLANSSFPQLDTSLNPVTNSKKNPSSHCTECHPKRLCAVFARYLSAQIHTICYLQAGNQESELYSSVRVQKPENQGNRWSRRLEIWNYKVTGQEKMAVSTLGEGKKKSALPGVFALFVLSTYWMMPTHHGQGRSFLLSPVQMLIFSGPHRHT